MSHSRALFPEVLYLPIGDVEKQLENYEKQRVAKEYELSRLNSHIHYLRERLLFLRGKVDHREAAQTISEGERWVRRSQKRK